MAVNTTENMKSYACGEGVTDFAFPFSITGTDTSVIIVTIWEDATSTPKVLAEESGAYSYSVSAPNNNYENGGTISTTKLDGVAYIAYAYDSGYTITIERIVPYTQPSEFAAGGLNNKALEQTFDNLEFQIQQLDNRKSIHGPASDPTTSIYELPMVSARKGRVLGFDDTTGDVRAVSVLPTSGVSITAFGETLIDDTTAAIARATLGITTANVTGVFNVKDPPYNAKGDGVTDDKAAIQAAESDADSNGGLIYFPTGTYLIEGDVTISDNVYLRFAPSAMLSIANGVTVTIKTAEHIIAGQRQQIFSLTGTGRVIFSGLDVADNLQVGKVYPGWWGAKGDRSTNDTAAIQAALDCAPSVAVPEYSLGLTVYFPRGYYMFSNLDVSGRTLLAGDEMMYASRLERIIGSVGNAIEDTGDAAGITIRDLDIRCNDCVGDGIRLGVDGLVWGYNGHMNRVRVADAVGYGINVKLNGNSLTNIQVTHCSTGKKIDGVGGLLTNIFVSGEHPVTGDPIDYGLQLDGYLHHLHGFRSEGEYNNAAIHAACNLTTLSGLNAAIGPGKTLPAVIKLADNCDSVSIFGISAYAYAGDPDGIITALIEDDSFSADGRIVYGLEDGAGFERSRYWNEYHSGRHQNLDTSLLSDTYFPADGGWARGDLQAIQATYGYPLGGVCMVAGSPGTWSAHTTLPGAVAKTTDYSVLAADNGKRFSNAGAGGTVVFTLPVDAVELEYEFISTVSGQVLRIDPADATDHFVNQAGGKYMALNYGEIVRIGRYESNVWYVIKQVGTLSYEG